MTPQASLPERAALCMSRELQSEERAFGDGKTVEVPRGICDHGLQGFSALSLAQMPRRNDQQARIVLVQARLAQLFERRKVVADGTGTHLCAPGDPA